MFRLCAYVVLVLVLGLSPSSLHAQEKPATSKPADLLPLELAMKRLQDDLHLAAARLAPDCLRLAQEWGRAAALVAELDSSVARVRAEAERLDARHRGLKSLPDVTPASLQAAEEAVKAARAHEKLLADTQARLRERLASLERDYVRQVVDLSRPSHRHDDAELLERVKALLTPPPVVPPPTPRAPCRRPPR